MKYKWVLAALMSCAIIIVVVGLRPVPRPTAENTVSVSALVKGLEVMGSNDIVFEVEDFEKEYFYINRGAEQGLDVKTLEAYLRGKRVELAYIQHRSLLDPKGNAHHLVRVSCGDSLIFAQ